MGKGQQDGESGHSSELVLTNRNLHCYRPKTRIQHFVLILGDLNYSKTCPFFPLFFHHWHFFFCEFSHTMEVVFPVFGKKSHIRLQPRRREGWRKGGRRPGVDGMWKASQSSSRNRDSHRLQFPQDPGKISHDSPPFQASQPRV